MRRQGGLSTIWSTPGQVANTTRSYVRLQCKPFCGGFIQGISGERKTMPSFTAARGSAARRAAREILPQVSKNSSAISCATQNAASDSNTTSRCCGRALALNGCPDRTLSYCLGCYTIIKMSGSRKGYCTWYKITASKCQQILVPGMLQ